MSDDRDFRSWGITPEQADKIAAGDRAESLVFYERHQKRFMTLAKNYASRHNLTRSTRMYDPEEMITQLFLDLPYLNWQNSLTLTLSIKQTSFAWSAYGGYAQRVATKQIHSKDPWYYYPDPISINSPIFEEDEDGRSLLDFFAYTSEEENPEGILLAKEAIKPLEATQIVERLSGILSPMEKEFLELYLEGWSYSQISEALSSFGKGSLQRQTFSKLIRNYSRVIDLVFGDKEFPSELSGLVPDNYEDIQRIHEERVAKKRKGDKGDKPKRVFATDAERLEAEKESKRKWYEKNKELQNERRRARRAAEREARKARASV